MEYGGLLASHLKIDSKVYYKRIKISTDGENRADISHNSIMLQSISVSINTILAEYNLGLLQCFALCVGVGANCTSAGCEDSVKCSSRKLGAAGSSGVGMTHGHY